MALLRPNLVYSYNSRLALGGRLARSHKYWTDSWWKFDTNISVEDRWTSELRDLTNLKQRSPDTIPILWYYQHDLFYDFNLKPFNLKILKFSNRLSLFDFLKNCDENYLLCLNNFKIRTDTKRNRGWLLRMQSLLIPRSSRLVKRVSSNYSIEHMLSFSVNYL